MKFQKIIKQTIFKKDNETINKKIKEYAKSFF